MVAAPFFVVAQLSSTVDAPRGECVRAWIALLVRNLPQLHAEGQFSRTDRVLRHVELPLDPSVAQNSYLNPTSSELSDANGG